MEIAVIKINNRTRSIELLDEHGNIIERGMCRNVELRRSVREIGYTRRELTDEFELFINGVSIK
jgi:hypothetical protein